MDRPSTFLVPVFVGLVLHGGGLSAATLIGPGAEITQATAQDTPGEERLNVDRTTFVTLAAGTYSVNDWRLNVFSHTEGGTITPILVSGTPASYTAEWIGVAFDPTSNGVQTVAASGTFTLNAPTDIYAGFFTAGLGSGIIALDPINSGSGSSITDHDNSPTPPASVGDPVAGFSHAGISRTYAFEINVDVVPEPSVAGLVGLGSIFLIRRRCRR